MTASKFATKFKQLLSVCMYSCQYTYSSCFSSTFDKAKDYDYIISAFCYITNTKVLAAFWNNWHFWFRQKTLKWHFNLIQPSQQRIQRLGMFKLLIIWLHSTRALQQKWLKTRIFFRIHVFCCISSFSHSCLKCQSCWANVRFNFF